MQEVQLFCITYAGGTSADFESLRQSLTQHIDVQPLEYAGHGMRRKEPFYITFEAMVTDMLSQVRLKRNKEIPYAFLGYSLGTLVVYEVLKHYLQEDDKLQYIFMAAHTSPEYRGESYDYWKLDDNAFIEKISQYGGINEKLLTDSRFFEVYLTPIREDYRLLGQYECKSTEYILPVPATVLYCEKDISYKKMQGWKKFFQGDCRFIQLGENHFFLKTHSEEMAGYIWESLKKKGLYDGML